MRTGEHHSHIVTHRHADGAIHTHAIDDDNGALAKHIETAGLEHGAGRLCRSLPDQSALSVATSDEVDDRNAAPPPGGSTQRSQATSKTPQHSLAARGPLAARAGKPCGFVGHANDIPRLWFGRHAEISHPVADKPPARFRQVRSGNGDLPHDRTAMRASGAEE